MSGSLRLGFSDYEQVYAKKNARREILLDEIGNTIPWDDFHALIRPANPFAQAKPEARPS